jgi:surfeit locus 1 family protein
MIGVLPFVGFVKTPRGAILTTVVIALAMLFVNLGLWQLDRHRERRVENQVMSARLESDTTPVATLLASVGSDLSSLEYRPVVVEGEYLPELELLVRNMTNRGQAGFHVITPLQTVEAGVVLVNRGWVPLDMDRPPVAAAPPGGTVEVEGVVRLTQLRPSLGRVEPEGVLEVVSRVDIERLAQQLPDEVAPVWVQVTTPDGASRDVPVAVPVPDFSDGGPHLMYAIEWFAFALIGIVGYFYLVRNQVVRRRRRTPT